MSESGRVIRFFLADLPDQGAADKIVSLGADESHHARNVLRLGVDSAVELFDGRGGQACGRVVSVGRSGVQIAILAVSRQPNRPGPAVHVAFAVPKGKRIDWLLEKTTELAAASLRPVIFQRSAAGSKQLSPAKQSRWRGHCLAAAKQAGLNFLPELHEPIKLPDLLKSPPTGVKLLGDMGDDAMTICKALAEREPSAEVTLLIGPEGGLTDSERSDALAAGFAPVKIGSTTLRVETACIALLAGVTALAMDTKLPAR